MSKAHADTELLNADYAVTVACPSCGRERAVEPGRYLCSRCSVWFDVRVDGGELA